MVYCLRERTSYTSLGLTTLIPDLVVTCNNLASYLDQEEPNADPYLGNGQIRRHFGVFSETML